MFWTPMRRVDPDDRHTLNNTEGIAIRSAIFGNRPSARRWRHPARQQPASQGGPGRTRGSGRAVALARHPRRLSELQLAREDRHI